ncbi:UDP-3-O-(3-hydroxymyristoyl)glucosamine N-acyltransferase [Vibrio anguillarum]|uniref:UDP-3-O-(3-hydroxymyristoyl)glucosamine N-acyltransferase n=1 Tax=Vibrio TaxID=662 RepID=UPI000B7BD7EA|nr:MULTISPECIES: UDP-3-O-(3-hydroxymyristoyl)glucosamine N-acyltransferase [Vibrio]ASO27841.1 UDP-3-O-(3-hydroxymyristoyl)glucosamine N-acyltransferase [Vibrio anguillarum]NAW98845.1 UDP-3-O-(3-hydroxymyristoyl)glucosamine N-acyltransferase [Vibrio sp. V23_P3S9T160]OXX48126.1 UDP-3-O-(3-hydroxymyristoyl)glucosamine N-acyltransferase [Vibrio sp. V11_P1A41T118]PRQ61366.1 UDP-3-O-(3-hydroxymyristoyl)glucosamine N-acyltransferase [Vibrio sp. V01_P9A10T6]
MANVRIILDKYVIKDIARLTEVHGRPIEAPYEFKTLSSITDFSIVFNTKDNGWTLDNTEVVSVILAKCKPENWLSATNITLCICNNPRDVYAYLMNIAVRSRRGAWTKCDQISYVHPSAKIHHSTQLDTNVYVDEGVEIGANCSIGFQGFGFGRLNSVGYQFIHTGGAYIGRNTKISNNVTVVAGTFKATNVGENVLVDDHVHIAHNCQIGANSTLTASTTLSGSVTIGKGDWLGPNSSVINGAELGDEVFVGIGACVTKSFEAGVIAGNPAKKLRVEK